MGGSGWDGGVGGCWGWVLGGGGLGKGKGGWFGVFFNLLYYFVLYFGTQS